MLHSLLHLKRLIHCVGTDGGAEKLWALLVEKDKALQRSREEEVKLRNRVSQLQADMENTEKVSLDFVRLSQHLQVRSVFTYMICYRISSRYFYLFRFLSKRRS
ncbi:unnamed protein product, partial [Hydatigera taeniaeformis]|uniref:BMERB domain-containing protein n=1 Tax=Hydatigena taeniaeformis TaxID=6205 RepID=A0A0R3WWT1_HYDTA